MTALIANIIRHVETQLAYRAYRVQMP